MSLIYSGFVAIGILIIAVAIYIVCIIAWYAYRRHVLFVTEENDAVRLEKYFHSMRWKPFLLTFNILSKDNDGNGSDDAVDVERSCGNQVCVVCLKGFEEGELVRQFPQCLHTFHADCIDKWLYSHSDCCPLCRSPITPPVPSFSSR